MSRNVENMTQDDIKEEIEKINKHIKNTPKGFGAHGYAHMGATLNRLEALEAALKGSGCFGRCRRKGGKRTMRKKSRKARHTRRR